MLLCVLAPVDALLTKLWTPSRRAPARFPPPTMLRDCYDVVVIGGGPVGVTAALRAAGQGRTAIVIDATPPAQFQFTGPTGLFSKALRDTAKTLDIESLRAQQLDNV